MPELSPGVRRQRMVGPALGRVTESMPGGRSGASADRHTLARVPPTEPDEAPLASEPDLLGAALALGARDVPGWSPAETALARDLDPPRPPATLVAALRARIAGGGDPLGEAFCRLRPPELRRADGATYTPAPIVEAMVAWAARRGRPRTGR